jgi:hypothetical protein
MKATEIIYKMEWSWKKHAKMVKEHNIFVGKVEP